MRKKSLLLQINNHSPILDNPDGMSENAFPLKFYFKGRPSFAEEIWGPFPWKSGAPPCRGSRDNALISPFPLLCLAGSESPAPFAADGSGGQKNRQEGEQYRQMNKMLIGTQEEKQLSNEISAPYEVPQYPIEQIETKLIRYVENPQDPFSVLSIFYITWFRVGEGWLMKPKWSPSIMGFFFNVSGRYCMLLEKWRDQADPSKVLL